MDTEKKQLELDKRYIRMASIWAENSYCQRRKVGALIVKDKMIISDGYNGTPSGFENVCEDETTRLIPACMINFAHSIQGEAVTYIVAPSLLLFERAILVIAFASAWRT